MYYNHFGFFKKQPSAGEFDCSLMPLYGNALYDWGMEELYEGMDMPQGETNVIGLVPCASASGNKRVQIIINNTDHGDNGGFDEHWIEGWGVGMNNWGYNYNLPACPECGGTGEDPYNPGNPCPFCYGTGYDPMPPDWSVQGQPRLRCSGTWDSFYSGDIRYYAIWDWCNWEMLMTMPSTNPAGIRFWYDETKWRNALEGTDRDIMFDCAGNVYWVERGGAWSTRNFICGPTFADGYGKNATALYFAWDDTGGMYMFESTGVPFSGKENSGSIHETAMVWRISSPDDIAYSDDGALSGSGDEWEVDMMSSGPRHQDFKYFKFHPCRNGYESSYHWEEFKSGSGWYYIKIGYGPWYSIDWVRGFEYYFWYDYSVMQPALYNTNTILFLDQLGNFWVGDPESGGTFLCGAPGFQP